MKLNTNQEKLNDAVGMLDGNIVQTAMIRAADLKETRIVRHATLRRRAVVLLAACLSLTLMIGALLAIPMMTPHNPPVTSGEDALPAYVEMPMVRLTNLSATEAATVSDPDMPIHESNIQVDSVAYRYRYTILTIDCKPGETVTVNADSKCLRPVEMPLTEDTDLSWGGEFYEALLHNDSTVIDWVDGGRVSTLTFDPATSCISVLIPMSSTDLDEAILNFSITDEGGNTTGVGSLYVGVKRLVNREEDSHVRGGYAVTRCAVLGSARFTDPASVTREQADRLVESFVAKADTRRAELDYTPVTKDEKRTAAMAEIILTEFAVGDVGALGRGYGRADDFCRFRVESKETGMERCFIVFDNGDWFEYLVHGDCNNTPCHVGCPHSAEWEHHGIMEGCRFTSLDGSLYEYVIEIRDGQESGTLVPASALSD